MKKIKVRELTDEHIGSICKHHQCDGDCPYKIVSIKNSFVKPFRYDYYNEEEVEENNFKMLCSEVESFSYCLVNLINILDKEIEVQDGD